MISHTELPEYQYDNMIRKEEDGSAIDGNRMDCFINGKKESFSLNFFKDEKMRLFVRNFFHQDGFQCSSRTSLARNIAENYFFDDPTCEKKSEFNFFSDDSILFTESFAFYQVRQKSNHQLKYNKNNSYKILPLTDEISASNAIEDTIYIEIIKHKMTHGDKAAKLSLNYAILSPDGTKLNTGKIEHDDNEYAFLKSNLIDEINALDDYLLKILAVTARNGHTPPVLPIAKVTTLALLKNHEDEPTTITFYNHRIDLFDETYKDLLFKNQLEYIHKQDNKTREEVEKDISAWFKNNLFTLYQMFSAEMNYQPPFWLLDHIDEDKVYGQHTIQWIATQESTSDQLKLLNRINKKYVSNNEIKELINQFATQVDTEDQQLVSSLQCINNVLLNIDPESNPVIENLFSLYNVIAAEKAKQSTRNKGSAAAAGTAGAAIAAASIAAAGPTAGLSLPLGAAISLTCGFFSSGSAAAISTLIESNLLTTCKKLLESSASQFLENQNYPYFAALKVYIILQKAKARTTKDDRDAQLNTCINAMKYIEKNDLKSVCKELRATYKDIYNSSSTSKSAIDLNNLVDDLIKNYFDIMMKKEFNLLDLYRYLQIKVDDIRSCITNSTGENIDLSKLSNDLENKYNTRRQFDSDDMSTCIELVNKTRVELKGKKCYKTVDKLGQLLSDLDSYCKQHNIILTPKEEPSNTRKFK